MKNLLKASVFAMATVLSSGAMAATGTGHAQAELSNPLTVTNTTDLSMGVISIDPAAGTQTVSITSGNTLSCPPTYSCDNTSATKGYFTVTGAPGSLVDVDVNGTTATLSDGLGHTLIFDPDTGTDGTWSNIPLTGGTNTIPIHGDIIFTGNEVAGVYSTRNAGGSGYQITVNY